MNVDYLCREEFDRFVERFPFIRKITSVHLHQTKDLKAKAFAGARSMDELAHEHMDRYGLQDFAQHVTIDPEGRIWLGRNWNLPPVSAAGHNGNDQSGPFMVTIVGDFDPGGEKLTLQQHESLLHVIARVQVHADLGPDMLVFRRELTAGTGPGATIDKQQILSDLRTVHVCLKQKRSENGSKQMVHSPFSDEAMQWNRILSRFQATARTGRDRVEEIPERENPMSFVQTPNGPDQRSGVAVASTDSQRLAESQLTLEMIDALQPHAVNLSQGRFSTSGHMQTYSIDVDAIFNEHIPQALEDARRAHKKLHLLFYAHGGLVSEKNALLHAHSQLDWWRDNYVYPVFFIWETGFLEILYQLISGENSRARAMTRQWITDPVIDKLVRQLGGPTVWQGMKSSAQRSTDAVGGAAYVADRLQDLCNQAGADLLLHAVGHSAGSIFLSHFLPCALQRNIPAFESMQLLAPAITVADFSERLAPLLHNQRIRNSTIFTLRRNYEERDPTARIYNRSILYLLHYGLEPEPQTPILGLEISLRQADPTLQKLLGVTRPQNENAQVVWAPTGAVVEGQSACQAKTHVDFNVDPPTMNSVLRRILHIDDHAQITPYPGTQEARSLFAWDSQFDWPPGLEWLRNGKTPSPTQTQTPSSVQTTTSHQIITRRRRSLCVGINTYRTNPLSGCVSDAKRWDETLQGMGFEPAILLLDQDATRNRIMAELEKLITNSHAGDVLVFQYAGHGIQLPDVSGDEADGDTPLKDEALCPHDFDSGAFLIDDDIAEILKKLPADVNLTCFFDCCHSGTISRFAVGVSSQAAGRSVDERPRYLEPTPALVQAHIRFRRQQPTSRMMMSRGPENMREVVFSACQSQEVAWESGGQGEFTLRATDLLRKGQMNSGSNAQFIEAVVQAFGSTPRQHPNLDCAPGLRSQPLLEALAETSQNLHVV
ncbi:peptidase C14 [bacterium]|nr:peptidase C14 [bacterium]